MRISRGGPVAVVIAMCAVVVAACSTPAEPRSGPIVEAPAPAASQQTAAQPPGPGSVLLPALPSGGWTDVVPANDGAGFSVVVATSASDPTPGSATAFDRSGRQMASVPLDDETGRCGVLDVAPAGRRLLVTVSSTSSPARGVEAATYAWSLAAWDASSGARVWTAELVAPQPEPLACTHGDGRLFLGSGGMAGVEVSRDSSWTLVHQYVGTELRTQAVDLASGRVLTDPTLLGAFGRFVVRDRTTSVDRPAVRPVDIGVPGASPLGTFDLTTSDGDEGIQAEFPSGPNDGVFDVHTVGSSPPAGVSADGTVLFTYEHDSGIGRPTLRAYRLPSMDRLWSTPAATDSDQHLVAEGGGTLLVRRVGRWTTSVVGVDAMTGVERWTVLDVQVCGITASQVLVATEDQLAVIDLQTGRQVAYEQGNGMADATRRCPAVIRGGVMVSPDGAVVQKLTP